MDTQEIAVMEDQQYSPQQITLDDALFNKCERLAGVMASSKCTVPKHLQGSKGDCFAIIGQSLRWGMDPYAVAQKTHLVNGTLGYEAQLVIAVINNRAPITDRIKFDYFGDWSKVKTKDDKSDDVGVVCSATVKGDDAPTELSLTMAQVGTVRNSPLWAADPRQQLAYLAAKKFARLHFPDVILGVYTPDELADRGNNEAPRNVTPKTANAGASALLDRVKKQPTASAPVIEYYDTSDLMTAINNMQTLEDTQSVVADIQKAKDDTDTPLQADDLKQMQIAWTAKKKEIVTGKEYDNIMTNIKKCKDLETVDKLRQVIVDKFDDFSDQQTDHLNTALDEVSEDIGAQG